MRILLTHRFFWPDTAPYALILRKIGDILANDGHEVSVFSSQPSYRNASQAEKSSPKRELLGKLSVRRVTVIQGEKNNPLARIFNVAIYCFWLCLHILRVKPDVVMASTYPPVIAAWCASFFAKLVGAKFIYHVMDIHPEVSKFTNGFLGKGVPLRILTWLDNQTLRRSSKIIVLSEDMKNTLVERGLDNLPLEIIENLPLEDFGEQGQPPSEFLKPKGKIRAIFAGNLGKYQNLHLLAEGIAECFSAYPNLELVFMGDGQALAELKEKWERHPQIKFFPFLPYQQAKEIMREADIGLVSLAPDIYRVAYPSKISTYRALGLPILVLVEGKWIHVTNGCPNFDKDGLGPDDFKELFNRLQTTLSGDKKDVEVPNLACALSAKFIKIFNSLVLPS
ncbi:glycosyltransferase family 4 protein [Maritalea myrionectae]|uniref:glycosyltransferase family 4 protein n=1 Tax=Maritalea myrionectae TaxID=454601 RepID=UPI0003FF4742|nr:glycosyltransferase family 4 protein [Maritalea myrionectae]